MLVALRGEGFYFRSCVSYSVRDNKSLHICNTRRSKMQIAVSVVRADLLQYLSKELQFREFPGSPVVRTFCFPWRDHRFDSWLGNRDPTSHVV